MFTGIIETIGSIEDVIQEKENFIFKIRSSISSELKVDQSVSHDGVCLTVTQVQDNLHTVVAVKETLEKTALRQWQKGKKVNLERCLQMGGRLDGHWVLGHVDQTGVCTKVEEVGGSWYFTFQYEATLGNFTVEKGSICVNGISLTVVNSKIGEFSVAIIPYTFEHTNLHGIKENDSINLEFDVLGKYIAKIVQNPELVRILANTSHINPSIIHEMPNS